MVYRMLTIEIISVVVVVYEVFHGVNTHGSWDASSEIVFTFLLVLGAVYYLLFAEITTR